MSTWNTLPYHHNLEPIPISSSILRIHLISSRRLLPFIHSPPKFKVFLSGITYAHLHSSPYAQMDSICLYIYYFSAHYEFLKSREFWYSSCIPPLLVECKYTVLNKCLLRSLSQNIQGSFSKSPGRLREKNRIWRASLGCRKWPWIILYAFFSMKENNPHTYHSPKYKYDLCQLWKLPKQNYSRWQSPNNKNSFPHSKHLLYTYSVPESGLLLKIQLWMSQTSVQLLQKSHFSW